MKYCSKCGKELVDEAIICTGCGCSVQYENHSINKEVKKYSYYDPMKAVYIMSFISNILLALTLTFVLNALISGYIYIHEDAYYTYVNFYFEESWIYCSLISAFPTIIFNIITLVLYKTRSTEPTLDGVLKYVSKLIAAILLLSVAGSLIYTIL